VSIFYRANKFVFVLNF